MPHTTAKDHLSAQLSIINPFILKNRNAQIQASRKYCFIIQSPYLEFSHHVCPQQPHLPYDHLPIVRQIPKSNWKHLAYYPWLVKKQRTVSLILTQYQSLFFFNISIEYFFCRKNVIFSYHKNIKPNTIQASD